jgi:hypothetical protein
MTVAKRSDIHTAEASWRGTLRARLIESETAIANRAEQPGV